MSQTVLTRSLPSLQTIGEDTFSAIPQVDSPAIQEKQRTRDIIVETTASQPIALLSS